MLNLQRVRLDLETEFKDGPQQLKLPHGDGRQGFSRHRTLTLNGDDFLERQDWRTIPFMKKSNKESSSHLHREEFMKLSST